MSLLEMAKVTTSFFRAEFTESGQMIPDQLYKRDNGCRRRPRYRPLNLRKVFRSVTVWSAVDYVWQGDLVLELLCPMGSMVEYVATIFSASCKFL